MSGERCEIKLGGQSLLLLMKILIMMTRLQNILFLTLISFGMILITRPLATALLFLVILAGTLLISRDGGESFELAQQADRQGLSTALPTADGGLVLIGEFGVNRLAAEALSP